MAYILVTYDDGSSLEAFVDEDDADEMVAKSKWKWNFIGGRN